MLVDTLLRWIGHNPEKIAPEDNKWFEFVSYLSIEYIFPYLPYALVVGIWVYFIIHRKRYLKNRKDFVRKIVLYSIGAYILGWVLIWLFLGIWGSLAAYSMYGGTI